MAINTTDAVIYKVKQPFFPCTTEHIIKASGGSDTKQITIDAAYDFNCTTIGVSGYDEDGSFYQDTFRHDCFKLFLKSNTSGSVFQNESYDIKHFVEMLRAGKMPPIYLTKGSILDVVVSHHPKSPNAVPKFPVSINLTFFGSLLVVENNPNYRG
jgi:hypothetical protein